MGWSTTAPTLPSGATWEQEQTTSVGYNYWALATTRSIVRLGGNQFAVRIICVVSNGSYGSFISPGAYVFRCDIDGDTGTSDTSFTMAKGTTTYYFTGEAAAGVSIQTVCGYSDATASQKTVTFTAPALTKSIKLWKKVSGTWTLMNTLVSVS